MGFGSSSSKAGGVPHLPPGVLITVAVVVGRHPWDHFESFPNRGLSCFPSWHSPLHPRSLLYLLKNVKITQVYLVEGKTGSQPYWFHQHSTYISEIMQTVSERGTFLYAIIIGTTLDNVFKDENITKHVMGQSLTFYFRKYTERLLSVSFVNDIKTYLS